MEMTAERLPIRAIGAYSPIDRELEFLSSGGFFVENAAYTYFASGSGVSNSLQIARPPAKEPMVKERAPIQSSSRFLEATVVLLLCVAAAGIIVDAVAQKFVVERTLILTILVAAIGLRTTDAIVKRDWR